MRSRLGFIATAAAAWILMLAPAALAQEVPDNGEGILGETDDKIVTFFSLGVIVFFVLVAALGSVVQSRLDRRKEEQKAVRIHQRTGW